MKKLISISILICFLYSCASTNKIHTQTSKNGPDGSSFENAIMINEKTSFDGIAAEWEWLKSNYPGFKFNGQYLIEKDNVFYDKMDIITRDGQSKSIYFNKSNYFKKIDNALALTRTIKVS
jgi:hypothetical protein